VEEPYEYATLRKMPEERKESIRIVEVPIELILEAEGTAEVDKTLEVIKEV
jgi:hypothetical protein